MSQCLNVSCLAACLRERVSRAPAQPGYRALARAARLGETHPGIRSPVARPKIRIPAPQRPEACGFSACVAASNLPRVPAMFLAASARAALPRADAAAAAAAAAAAGGAAALARARDATARRRPPAPCRRAQYRACGGVARPSELRLRARCCRRLLSAQLIHMLTTGEEIFWAELRHWTTGGISPPQLCLTVRAECLRGPMSDRLRARAAAPTTTCAHRRRRPLRARHAH